MKKKKKIKVSRSATRKPQTTHVHYFYVIGAALVVGAVVAGFLIPVSNEGVLGASNRRAEADVNGGNVQIRKIHSDNGTKTEIKIDTKKGDAFEIDNKSGERRRGRPEKLERLNKEIDAIEASGEAHEVREASEGGKEKKDKKPKKAKIRLLPEKAIQALLKNGIISEMNPAGSPSAEDSQTVTYKRVKGNPVFVIQGKTEKKVFGLIPVEVEKTVTVSAEDGTIQDTDMSPFDRIINLLSL